MSKRMLIEANHPEETRVVVLSGNRLEEFDYETTAKQQLKGNIYLAKVTRVEPSLQAAFVEYGGNRHGFLPFSEIHPDYYRIPIADREALAAEETARRGNGLGDEEDNAEFETAAGNGANGEDQGDEDAEAERQEAVPSEAGQEGEEVEQLEVESRVDTLGGDEVEDDRRRRARLLRRYKIQEVIKRRQIILVQVAKEARGTKGAALTTYLSLAGRYCVLMPNTGRGGGISRKIASASDRRRLKNILSELEIPEGMAVIVRTAGSERSKAEVHRDYDYLLRLWSEIRDTTLQATAPCLIHEEASLIKRSIRDLYSQDMDEVLVEGEAGYKACKAFMRTLTPSHARKVKQYKDATVPLFHKFNVEGQLDAIHNSTVHLKAGGYIVINSTEALVAIDVNSGKATRERHIEETAFKTNSEAAEEVARQLRLRDLAGLVVIDFIDMEQSRHNREVERKLREAMRPDRARVQLGRISPFGLLEMSRQRLRPSLFEVSTDTCPRCGGTGHVRSIASSALNILRAIGEEGLRRREGELRVSMPTSVALHVLNQLRDRLIEIEQRYDFKVHIETNDDLIPPEFRLNRLSEGSAEEPEESRAAEEDGGRKRRRRPRRRKADDEERAVELAPDEAEPDETEAEVAEAAGEEQSGDEDYKKSRRRRGKRGGRRRSRRRAEAVESTEDGQDVTAAAVGPAPDAEPQGVDGEEPAAEPAPADPTPSREPPVQELPVQELGDTDASEAPAKPKRPRRRKAKAKPAEADAAAETTGESPPETAEAAIEEAAAEPETRAAGKKVAAKPRRRTRRSSVRTAEDKGADEAQAETANGGAEGAAPVADGDGPAGPAPRTPIGRVDIGHEMPPASASTEDEGTAPPDDDDRPKRRGWWQRLV